MTESEAIEILKGKFPKWAYEGIYRDEDKYEYEMAQMAIQALEKQIPKKPTPIDYEKYINVIDNASFLRGAYWCPNCKHVVRSGSFCNDCGQALDWENT